jgi:hypothetical protein
MWRGYLLLPDSSQGPRSPPQINALFNALRSLIWREIGWSRLHGVRQILHTVVAFGVLLLSADGGARSLRHNTPHCAPAFIHFD